MSKTLMIAGCGDVGSRLGQQLNAAGWTVYGLRRNVALLPQGIRPVAGDLHADACPTAWPSEALDYLVYCAAATDHDEAGYRAAYVDGLRRVLGWLAQQGQRPKRVLFVSSSGVYGQQHGEWVDEQSPAEAGSYSGRIMREAEQLALHSGLPASLVRLTGLYGPGREWLLKQVRQGYRVVSEPPLYGYWPTCCKLMPVVCRWRTAISVSTTNLRHCMRWLRGCVSNWKSVIGPTTQRCADPAANAAAMPAPALWGGRRSTRATVRVTGRFWHSCRA